VPPDTRDAVVDFVRAWSDKTDIPVARFIPWIGIARSKYHNWIERFGKVNEHNAWVPRDHWLTDDEIARICNFARANPLEGYRRMTFMMLDQNVVACSPTSVYRVLKKAGLLAGQSPNVTKKGTGFVQPLKPHEHWHVDISYLNIAGTFYFLCSILDGCSRFIVHQEIREKMEEIDVETIVQRAREKFPGVTPRIITDNGPQFIAKDFKEFIRIAGMTHVRTSPYYPQSNGKIERWHKTIKGECIRTKVPLSLDDARRLVAEYVEHYNTVRLNSAVGYVTPQDKLLGNDIAIFAERDRKLAEAREQRKQARQTRHEQMESQPDASRPAIDFAAVRAAITIAQVLMLLNFVPRSDHHGQQRGACPLHGTTRGTAKCFSVNTSTHTFQCFKCNRSGNALDLWAAANRLTPYDAAIDLCQRLNIPLPLLHASPATANREEEPVANGSDTCTIP
jgi:transposase InsO family protein